MDSQPALFDYAPPPVPHGQRRYQGVLTVSANGKGCIDIDTVKGCARGMAAYPDGGCYGECYAAKTAARYGIDFTVSVSRRIHGREHRGTLIRILNGFPETWYRVGTAGDPSHDWSGTLSSLRALRHAEKTPVIVTKHWATMRDVDVASLRDLGAVVNTSVGPGHRRRAGAPAPAARAATGPRRDQRGPRGDMRLSFG